jgi:hypothetical protein
MNTPLASPPWRLCAALLLSLMLPACATEPTAAPKRAGTQGESAAQHFARLQALIGEAPCDSDDQCRTIGVGAKACGGPGRYLAWSTRNVKPAELEAQAQAYAQAVRAENERSGLVSDCSLVTDPGALCRARRCELQRPRPGAGLPVR